MGITKTEYHSDRQNEMAQLFKVLGHPARIAIIEAIVKENSCVCGDLVTEIGLAQPTISQHLKELKKIGIIKGTVEGTSVCYCIDSENLANIQLEINKMFNEAMTQSECC